MPMCYGNNDGLSLVAALLIQVPANVHGKVVGDGQGSWDPEFIGDMHGVPRSWLLSLPALGIACTGGVRQQIEEVSNSGSSHLSDWFLPQSSSLLRRGDLLSNSLPSPVFTDLPLQYGIPCSRNHTRSNPSLQILDSERSGDYWSPSGISQKLGILFYLQPKPYTLVPRALDSVSVCSVSCSEGVLQWVNRSRKTSALLYMGEKWGIVNS